MHAKTVYALIIKPSLSSNITRGFLHPCFFIIYITDSNGQKAGKSDAISINSLLFKNLVDKGTLKIFKLNVFFLKKDVLHPFFEMFQFLQFPVFSIIAF